MSALPLVLRLGREKSGMSLRQVARATGINHTTIQRYENGERCPKINRVLKLALAYGIPKVEIVEVLADDTRV